MATFISLLASSSRSDFMFDTDADTSDGWKISIQGRSIKDADFLHTALSSFLKDASIPFKVGTAKRINSLNKVQSRKVMTIYCPNNIDINSLAEQVYQLTFEYKGWYDIPTPSSYSHYAGGLFIRNDRVNGQYVPC